MVMIIAIIIIIMRTEGTTDFGRVGGGEYSADVLLNVAMSGNIPDISLRLFCFHQGKKKNENKIK